MVKFWVSLVVGIFCILAWLGGRQEAAESRQWPSVPGQITSRKITESRSRDGGIDRSALIKYSYSVNGKIYEGDRIKVEATTDVSEAEHYPEGTAVVVFYNAAKPEVSVLQQGGSGMLLWGIAGIGCILFAAFTFYQRKIRGRV